MSPRLILGPLLRHVGTSDATVWVETDTPCEVEVRAGDSPHRSPTFTVEGHYYALVVITGLEPGSTHDYEVRLDGERVWPDTESSLPPSVIRTIAPDGGLTLAFGSCRVSVPHEPPYTKKRGVARRALAARGSDLRRRGLHGHPRIYPLAARHERAPRRGGRGLRGVHAPLLGRLEGPRYKVGALDGAIGYDLRRPRCPR